MKNYETVFILNPALSEEQVEKAVDKYEKYLKSNGAKIVSKEIWGLKKLAYTIQNKNSGFYKEISMLLTFLHFCSYDVFLCSLASVLVHLGSSWGPSRSQG